MNKMLSFIIFLSCFLLLFFSGAVVWLNVSILKSPYITQYFTFYGVFFSFVFLIFLFFTLNFTSKKINEKNHTLSIFIIALIPKLIFVMLINSRPESDFEIIFKNADLFANGKIKTLNAGTGGYYDIWAYQTVYTLYQALVLYIYDSIDALKILNVFFMAGSAVMIYKICKLIYSPNPAFVIACLFSLYPEMLFYAPVLTNQHLSTFFILVGIYFLFKNNYKSCMLAGVMLGIGDLMRPEVIIILIAAVFCFALSFIRPQVRKDIATKAMKFGLLLLFYMLIHGLASALIKTSGINKYGIENRNPEWKFMVGLDKEHNGAWNTSHANILTLTDGAERKAEVISYVKSTYHSFDDVISFVYEKQLFMWASPSPVYFTFNDGDLARLVKIFGKDHYMNDLVNIFLSVDKFYFIFIFLLFFISIAHVVQSIVRGFGVSNELYFILMICLVNFLIYLLIEVQPRYKYFIMPFVFISAGHLLMCMNSFDLKGFLSFRLRLGALKDKIES